MNEKKKVKVTPRKPYTSLCSKCKEQKTSDCFYASNTSWCKQCIKQARVEKELACPGYAADRKRAWRGSNPQSESASKKKYREANPEKNRVWVAAATAKFKAEHPEEYAAQIGEKAMRREAMKAQRTPSWSSPAACRLVYLQRVKLQKATGVRHAVDHSVPLRGKLVSGLHVPENLVVIPFEVNAQKSNKFDPMTYEWWPECCPRS